MALTSPDSRDAGSHDVTQYVEVELGLAHLEASDLEAGDECSFADGQHSMAPNTERPRGERVARRGSPHQRVSRETLACDETHFTQASMGPAGRVTRNTRLASQLLCVGAFTVVYIHGCCFD